MKRLNRQLLEELQSDAKNLTLLSEKVIQFGEGNFLRAFVDWMFHQLNKNSLFNGRVVLVQPIAEGLADIINEQDGLYTLFLRGLRNGEPVVESDIITSVSRCLNPYSNWTAVLQCAENPELEFVVSNTTEAGIVYNKEDSLAQQPPTSFPGKLATFLYHRFQHFDGDKTKGMVIIPCELIDRNGDNLKKVILQLANDWGLPNEFITWVSEHNYFLNTLVDRVVTGYPKDEIDQLTAELGYEDKLVDTGELFHLWVIEGPKELEKRLPFKDIGLNVIWTDDLTPYRTRKVRILNGAHTAGVPAAFLYGLDTVGEMMDHPVVGKFVRELIYDEIIPSIKGLGRQMLTEFADAVVERFRNPYIKHYLLNILLNSTSKFKTRNLPSLLEYYQQFGELPEKLVFALAALLSVYKEGRVEGAFMKAKREKGEFVMRDDLHALTFMAELWQKYDGTQTSAVNLAQQVLANQQLWGKDLNELPGLTEKVGEYLYRIDSDGIQKVLASTLK